MNQRAIYTTAQVLTILSTVFIALFIFIRGRQRETARHYAFYNLAIAGWSFCWIQMAWATSPAAGKFWAYFVQAPAALITPTFLHFVLSLTQFENKKWKKTLLYLSYGTGITFALLTFHRSFFIASAISESGLPYFPTMGPAFPYFIIFFLIVCASSLLILLLKFKTSSGSIKTQILYVLIAYMIGFFGGSHAFLPLFGFEIPFYAFFLIPVGQGIIAYAIFRHQLLETKIVIRRLALFISIYASLLFITIPLLYWFHRHVRPNPTMTYSFFESLFVGGILSVGPFLYATFVKSGSYFKEHTMSGLTHELKSPLAIIESTLEAMQSSSQDPKLIGNNMDYLKMLERNANRLRTLVNDLLIVFGNQGVNIDLKLEQISTDILLNESIKTHQDAADKKNIRLQKEILIQNSVIRCDTKKIIQVLSNLISNALKFTETGTIQITVNQKKDEIHFSVADTGRGIFPEDLPYIFDRFYQGHRDRNNKGTGIGLAISKIWVEAHGGKIWVEPTSVVGGTTITFSIPNR